jgi:hypothetical protein
MKPDIGIVILWCWGLMLIPFVLPKVIDLLGFSFLGVSIVVSYLGILVVVFLGEFTSIFDAKEQAKPVI